MGVLTATRGLTAVDRGHFPVSGAIPASDIINPTPLDAADGEGVAVFRAGESTLRITVALMSRHAALTRADYRGPGTARFTFGPFVVAVSVR